MFLYHAPTAAATTNDGRLVNPYGCRHDRLNMIKLRSESPGNRHRVSPIIPTTVYNIYKVETNNPSGVVIMFAVSTALCVY